MLLTFERRQVGHGLEIIDHVERRQCTVETRTPIDIAERPVDDFEFPVDSGVTFETDAVTFPHRMTIFLWNSMGFQFDEVHHGESRELPSDRYILEMSGPVKLYVVIESELEIDVTAGKVHLEMPKSNEILVSARSYHKNPAGTITTTSDPEDMMAAVSALSSALKSTSVERSFPTLRGHPPTIELGDQLVIPDRLEKPETGVTIEIPATLRHVFVVAPLAYYVGADVVAGPVPKLVTEDFEYSLDDTHRGFERETARVLKQVFFLDCLTRTEGYYPVNLHERNVLESELDLDFSTLYTASISEQLDAYLAIPFDVIQPELPTWKLTTRVELRPKNIEVLPFVINDLAIVRSADTTEIGETVDTFDEVEQAVQAEKAFTRGTADTTSTDPHSATTPGLIEPVRDDSIEQVWVGPGAPIGASKGMIEAYQHRIHRGPTDGDIDITVVCNNAAMNDERDIVDDIYGSRGELPFDIHGYHELSVNELKTVIEQDTDFLHYIGHIDERGFECNDGFLDAGNLEHTGIDAFLLNACTSYQQGMELIRAGSIAGVVTVQDVINSGAERIGSSLAKLLNEGYPLNTALNIAKNESIVGGMYLVLGDGGIDIAQAESVPGICVLDSDEPTTLTFETFTTFDKGLGTIAIPHAGDNNEYYIASGETGTFNLSSEELHNFLKDYVQPVRFRDSLFWTDDAEFAAIFSAMR